MKWTNDSAVAWYIIILTGMSVWGVDRATYPPLNPSLPSGWLGRPNDKVDTALTPGPAVAAAAAPAGAVARCGRQRRTGLLAAAAHNCILPQWVPL